MAHNVLWIVAERDLESQNRSKTEIRDKMKSPIKALKQAWREARVMFGFFYKNLKKDENDWQVKSCFLNYFEDNCFDINALQLHHIRVETKKAEVVVTVTLARPGLLIGKGGRTIHEIAERISFWVQKPVNIEINEYRLWS